MTDDLDTLSLLTGLVGGLALFLFGLDILTRALKQVAGTSLRRYLARVTENRLTGLAAGAAVTAVIQSSSITTVLLVGFISAGLMTTGQSVAVILGANIGTTITAQILAFKVTALALPLLALGFFVSFVSARKAVREYGRIVLGLGMVFFGMSIMSDAMSPLRSYAPFLDFMRSLDNVLLAALIGAGFTALVQSSSATTGILIVMAGQGLIALEPAVALALGANVGTCVTALLASLGKPRAAVRVALIHTLVNVGGVLIWIGFIDQLAALARLVAAVPDGAAGANVPRQLANVHTFFNVANAVLFLGFTTQITRLVEWLVPDRADPKARPVARYLDAEFLKVPAIALDAARREVLELGTLVKAMLSDAVPAIITGSPLDLDRLREMDRPVDLLHREIVGYLRQLGVASLPEKEARQMMALMAMANDLEHIGDLIATGLVTSARKRTDEEVDVSPATAHVIAAVHLHLLAAFNGVLDALETQDRTAAERVREMKEEFIQLTEQVASHELDRLQADAPARRPRSSSGTPSPAAWANWWPRRSTPSTPARSDYTVVASHKGNYSETLNAGIAAFRAGEQPDILMVFEVGTATMMAAEGRDQAGLRGDGRGGADFDQTPISARSRATTPRPTATCCRCRSTPRPRSCG
jgi:phosphate:Na+ symporter